MPSLVTYNNGLRRIDFALSPNGKRHSIRLGRTTARNAQSIKSRVEELIADRLTNRPHNAELCQWLADLDESMLKKLRRVGLADGVGLTQVSMGDFLDRVEQSQAVKPSTATFYGHTRRNLLDCFGRERAVSSITEEDADRFKVWLISDQGLAPATVSRRLVAARTFWRMAIRWRISSVNPFEGIPVGTQQNSERQQFIPIEWIEKVFGACPDAEWRALVALARCGGLRTPSESLALRWTDVNWEEGTLSVTSPKTAHHEGKATRIVPLFPELRTVLLEAFEAADDGAVFVITRYRETTQNLGTHFARIIKRAGLKPWPRLWQNLRASRETELMRDYDLATACKWIGNSPAVAAKHYAMSQDLSGDLKRAAGLVAPPSVSQAQQKAQQTASDDHCQPMTPDSDKSRKPLKDNASDNDCLLETTTVGGESWAVLDRNRAQPQAT